MSRHTIREWILALRPWSLPASTMPIVVSLAYLFFKGHDIDWLTGIWALIGMVLFHLSGNVWSDWFDFRKKVDAEDTFGAKSLTTGMFQPSEIRNLALILLVISIACGLGLVAVTGIELLYIGIAGAALTVLYPFLKYNALGDLDILFTFAFLPCIGTSYVATGFIDWSILWIAFPVGLITDGILHSNNTRDMKSDRRANINTMAMSLGTKTSALLYGFEMIFPYVWIGVLSMIGILPASTVFIFLTLPVAFGCAKTMKNSIVGGVAMISDLDVRTANLQLMFCVILAIGLIADRLI